MMKFRKQRPIYLQIADHLGDMMVQGEWKEDERVPSVRDVAAELGVNVNTVLHTFEYMQRNGIIYSRRGMGYFVAHGAKAKVLEIKRRYFMEDELPAFLQQMRLMGLTPKEVEQMQAGLEGQEVKPQQAAE